MVTNLTTRCIPASPLPANLAIVHCLVMVSVLLAPGKLPAAEAKYVSGSEFNKSLNLPILANREYAPLRQMLDRLTDERRIAILLDRRIDPGQLVDVDVQADFFDRGIAQLVAPVPAGVTVVADTVIVAPPHVAQTLRTRIALAERKLNELVGTDFGRQLDLSGRRLLHWEMLTSPQEILAEISRRYAVTIQNPEAIPHDLWAAGTIVHPNATEALQLIATQFGLDVEWIDSQSVRLVPEAKTPLIRTEHAIRSLSREQALDRVRTAFPEIQAEGRGDRLVVTGLLDQQEDIAVLLGSRSPRKAATPAISDTLSNRRFTLRMVDRPFSELVQVLEKQGIEIRRDDTALRQAGISLRTRISLELEAATIEKLMQDACRPLGLDYQVEGTRIDLFPARP